MRIRLRVNFIFLLIFPTWCVNIHAQDKQFTIEENSSPIVDSILNLPIEKFIFFCPTYNFNCKDYKSEFENLLSSLKNHGISDTNIYLICYEEVPEDASKNIILSKGSDKNYISSLQVYYSYKEAKRFKRAVEKLSDDYGYVQIFKNENLYEIDLNLRLCLDSLYKRIVFFDHVITETLKPNYSDSERIFQLKDSLEMANHAIDNLNFELKELNLKNDSLVYRLDRMEYFIDRFHGESIQSIEGEEYAEYSGEYVPPPIIEPKKRPKDAILTIGAILMSFFTMSFIVFS